MRCPRRYQPGGVGWGPAPRPRLAAPPREAEERARPSSGSARGAGALRARRSPASPRVQVHRRGQSPRLSERVLPPPAPRREFHVPRCSGDPTPPPSRPRWATGLECKPRRKGGTGIRVALLLRPARTHGRGSRQAQRGGSAWQRSSTSSPRCSEWNLESAGNCSNTQPALLHSALALLKRSISHQSLASPSPPQAPRRFVKRVRDLRSICLPGRKRSVAVPNERRVLVSGR